MKNIFCKNKKNAPKAKQAVLVLLLFVLFVSPLHIAFTTIDNKNTITVEQTIAHADNTGLKNPFECTSINVFSKGEIGFNFAQCFLGMPSFALFYLSGMMMAGGGWVFDTLTAFSISPVVIGADFVKEGWKTTRDMANMLFIFILLFIAISTILQLENYNTKKLLTKLIIIALLVNFSLFISRVIIDAGNITALFFYQGISTSAIQDANPEKIYNPETFFNKGDVLKIGELKGISEGFVAFIDPQRLFTQTPELFQKDNINDNVYELIFIYLASAVLMFVTAWIFFSIGFVFLGRIAVLWLLMAVAPLAFAAMILPKTQKIANEWWAELFSKSFCITVFLFFIWIITIFANGNLIDQVFKQTNTSGDILVFMVLMTIKFGTLIALLYVAKDITKKSCGQIHGMSMNIGSKVAGFAGMAVGGAGGMALRNTVGRVARGAAGSAWIKQQAAKGGAGGWAARQSMKTFERGAKATYDVRGAGEYVAKTGAGKALGITADLGKPTGKGGYDAVVAKQVKAREAVHKSLGKDGLGNTVLSGKTEEGGEVETTEKLPDGTYKKITLEGGSARQKRDANKRVVIDKKTKKQSDETAGDAYIEHLERERSVVARLKTDKRATKDREAALKLRKGKKTTKQQLEEIMKESGEIPKEKPKEEESKEEKPKTT